LPDIEVRENSPEQQQDCASFARASIVTHHRIASPRSSAPPAHSRPRDHVAPRLPERTHRVAPQGPIRLRVRKQPHRSNRIYLTSHPSATPTSIDQLISDFDNVTFHISTPTSKTQILISIAIKCWPELVKYGAEAVLEREYGPYIVSPEQGYDFSVQVDLENLPGTQEEKDQLVSRISLLKRHAMAAPFEQAFDEYATLHEQASHYTSESAPQGVREGGEVRAIHYRDPETIYIKASHDRVTVIFSTVFSDETDRVFGKVFLQEFADARRRAIQNAPQVLFRNDPPLELQGVPGLQSGKGEMSYITFGKCLSFRFSATIFSASLFYWTSESN
jgi:actin related protein 2/3 complex subunit 2